MNKNVSWDPSLVKKYSSSNHFKLLNQLRNEVKKYPLNKKKSIISDPSIANNIENKDDSISSNSQDATFIKDTNVNKDIKDTKSTVSFNNSKNFSIYNNVNNDKKNHTNEGKTIDPNDLNEEETSLTFKDRLKQIDMK